MSSQVHRVQAEWDPDASVWVATSDDVPGLVTEAATVETLESKLRYLVPELLEANGAVPADGSIKIELLARRITSSSAAGK